MFKTSSEFLERHRIQFDGFKDCTGTMSGAFQFKQLRVVASAPDEPGADGWEHVSVSVAIRCPTWSEMCYVKDLFWPEDEVVYQLHPPKSEWISNHPFCLHMWRNERFPVALPPAIMVGIKQDGEYKNKEEAIAGFKRAQERGDLK